VCINPLSANMVDHVEKFSALGWNVEFVGEARADETAFGRG